MIASPTPAAALPDRDDRSANISASAWPEEKTSWHFPTAYWRLAAFGAVLLHVTVAALAYANVEIEETDVAMGVPAIEIGLEMTAPHVETSDVPPGLLAEDSAAAAARPEQQVRSEEELLPVAKPIDTDDPDRLVTEKPVEKPRQVVKPETVQSRASTASLASEAAAPPISEKAKNARHSATAVQGSGDSDQRIVATWQRQLVAHLDRHKRYPKAAASRNATITVEFIIDRNGHLINARVSKSSGDPAFDEAALAMMHRSDPVPPPPALLADETLSFSIPVVFRQKRS